MSDNRGKYCKMSENHETYDKMLENRETYWQFPEAALAADWKWGCGGRSPPPGARTKFGSTCATKWKGSRYRPSILRMS